MGTVTRRSADRRIRRGDPRRPEALRPDSFSVAVHEVLSDLALRLPLSGVGALVVGDAISGVMRRRRTSSPALRLRLRCAIFTYLLRFAPPEDASAVQVADHCFDLAWRAGGALWVDEVKCGSFIGVGLREQVGRQLAAGGATWGEAFAGVRVVSLVEPCGAVFCTRGSVPPGLRVDAVIAGGRTR